MQSKKDLSELVFSTTIDANLPKLAEHITNFIKNLSNHPSLIFNIHLVSLHQLSYFSKLLSTYNELFSPFEFWMTIDLSRLSVPILARDIYNTPIPETICPHKTKYSKELTSYVTRFLIHDIKSNADMNASITRLLFNWQSYPAIYPTNKSNNFYLSASCFCKSCREEMQKYNIDKKTIFKIINRTNKKIRSLWNSIRKDAEVTEHKEATGDGKEVTASDIYVSDLSDSDVELIDDVDIDESVELDSFLIDDSSSTGSNTSWSNETASDTMYLLTYGEIPIAAVEYLYGNMRAIYSKLLKSPEIKLWIKYHALKSWNHNIALYTHFEKIINDESINAVSGVSFEALLPYPHFHPFQLHPISLGINYKKIKSHFQYKKLIFELPTAKILFNKQQLKVLNTTVGISNSKICHYSPSWTEECLIDGVLFALQGDGSFIVPAQDNTILELVLNTLPKIL